MGNNSVYTTGIVLVVAIVSVGVMLSVFTFSSDISGQAQKVIMKKNSNENRDVRLQEGIREAPPSPLNSKKERGSYAVSPPLPLSSLETPIYPLPVDIRVNENELFTSQGRPVVSSSGNTFVVAWEDYGDPFTTNPFSFIPLGRSIQARVFDATTGVPLSGNIEVSEPFNLDAYYVLGDPDVLQFLDGSFVVVWVEFIGGTVPNENEVSIKARFFDSSFSPVGPPITLNDLNPSILERTLPKLALLSNGNFAVIWNNLENDLDDEFPSLVVKVFNPLGSEICQNVIQELGGDSIAASLRGNNQFTVVSGETGGLAARIFNGDCTLLNTFSVSSPPSNVGDFTSTITYLSNNDIIIAWTRMYDFGFGSPPYDLYRRHFDNNGNSLSAELLLVTSLPEDHRLPVVSRKTSLTDYIIAWSHGLMGYPIPPHPGPFEVYSLTYDLTDSALTSTPLLVPTTHQGSQETGDIAPYIGGYVIVWSGTESLGSQYSDIFAKRFDNTDTPV